MFQDLMMTFFGCRRSNPDFPYWLLCERFLITNVFVKSQTTCIVELYKSKTFSLCSIKFLSDLTMTEMELLHSSRKFLHALGTINKSRDGGWVKASRNRHGGGSKIF